MVSTKPSPSDLTESMTRFTIRIEMNIINTVKTPILITIAVLLTLFVFTKIFGPIPFSVNSMVTTKSDLFTVDGVGEAEGVPTTASFSVGVTKTAATVEAAQDQTNAAINTIIEELKKLGIDEEMIKTSNYSVNPNIDFASGRQTTTGYTVSTNIDVMLDDTEKANTALDTATKNGANIISGVAFILSDENQDSLEKEARKEAIADAKEKAQEISREAGIKLGKVMNIYVSQDGGVMPYDKMVSMEARGGEMANPTELQPGQNKVTMQVTLTYETL